MIRRRVGLAGLVLFISALALPTAQTSKPGTPYYPSKNAWEQKKPEEVGLDGAKIEQAVSFVKTKENTAPRDLMIAHAISFGRQEPFDSPIGPMKTRAPLNGLIIKNGYVVADFGDTREVDMTFSVTKTFLSTVVGLAWQKGKFKDVNELARTYAPELFETPHNAKITWDHLLRQTSDWQGTLFGKPDWADRPEGQPADWANRKLSEPGTRYKYNDVRVNLLSLLTLKVLRRPLPDVLKEEVMDPIGASDTWRWHGYENSWVEIDGRKMQSVPGGGHWGGGMFISAYDMARFGYLFLRNGKWTDKQIVSPKWIEMARTPGKVNAEYGYMNWFLNTGRKPLPSAPESSVTFRGNGSNIIYIDWDNDLVVVIRWIGGGSALNDYIGQILGAIKSTSTQ